MLLIHHASAPNLNVSMGIVKAYLVHISPLFVRHSLFTSIKFRETLLIFIRNRGEDLTELVNRDSSKKNKSQ